MANEEGAAVSVDDIAYDALLEWIADEVAPYVGEGRVADYIPALAEVPRTASAWPWPRSTVICTESATSASASPCRASRRCSPWRW